MKLYIKKIELGYLSLFACMAILISSCDDEDYRVIPDAISPHTVTLVEPVRGDVGFEVVITGTEFSLARANNFVRFNETLTVVSAATPTSLTVSVPEGATTGEITVSHNGLIVSAGNFEVISIPIITDVNPAAAGEGEEVIITGEKFSATPADNVLSFNGISAVITEATETSITTTIPVGATTGAITLSVAGESTTSPDFIVQPRISEIAPLFGPVGTEVIITGTSFSETLSDNQVSFNGIAAVVTAATTTSITTTVPEGAETGIVSVTVNGEAIDGDEFTIGTLPVTITVAIAVEEDDVEESTVNGQMNLTSGDIELGELDNGFTPDDGDGLPKVGLRFVNITIPQGATVTNASIQFTADSSAGTDPVELTIYGEAADNADAYTDTAGDLSARTLTSANTVWTITETWTTDDKLPAQQTVDLSSIIQEVVNSPTWTAGNSINFIMIATGVSAAPTSTSQGREAEGFTDSTPGDTPELTLTYQE